MRILFCSYAFSPSVGGIETASETLAAAFASAGHEVVLATLSAGQNDIDRSFRVVRQPRWHELWSLCSWAEIIFQNNLSTRLLWPNVFLQKKCVVTTQTWLSGMLGAETRSSRLKRWILGKCWNVAISQAVAIHVGHPSLVVGNPFDDRTFQRLPNVSRTGELLFVGRLVSDKGLDILLRALAQMREAEMRPLLTVVGEGPERVASEQLVQELGLKNQVRFVGIVRGGELARVMNAHEILVVPSRWAEPFGIVALEGIACGCVVVGSDEGGLPEAIGPCGLTFPNGSVHGLVAVLGRVLTDSAMKATARQHADSHLRQYKAAQVAQKYLALFESTRDVDASNTALEKTRVAATSK